MDRFLLAARSTRVAWLTSAVLAISLITCPALAAEQALPEDYPPEYGAAIPMAVITATMSVVLFPLVAIPTLAFGEFDDVTKVFESLVRDPVEWAFRDRAGNAEY